MERRVPDITKLRRMVGYENTHDLDSMLVKIIEHERTR